MALFGQGSSVIPRLTSAFVVTRVTMEARASLLEMHSTVAVQRSG